MTSAVGGKGRREEERGVVEKENQPTDFQMRNRFSNEATRGKEGLN